MEKRHIRINYEEALNGKRHLLSSEISLLHMLRRIKAYKSLRSKELIVKNKLRIRLKDAKKKINSLNSTLPKEFSDKKQKKEKAKKTEKVEVSNRVQEELEEIKRKLENLS